MPKKGTSGPKRPEPKIIRPDDIDPKHRWDRPLQAPGRTQVDFEERIDFRRLHDYRLARTRAALAQSGLGALLCFDQHNIRYTTSTVIGEWARDKLTRYSLLTGGGDPYIWDFGSAAKAWIEAGLRQSPEAFSASTGVLSPAVAMIPQKVEQNSRMTRTGESFAKTFPCR